MLTSPIHEETRHGEETEEGHAQERPAANAAVTAQTASVTWEFYTALRWVYSGLLGVLTVYILWRGSGPMKRTLATMGTIYLAQLALAPSLWPSLWWTGAVAAMDVIGCVIVTWHPAGRWQSIIGLSFLMQFGMHMGRIIAELNNKIPDMNIYGWGLMLLAFLQLILVGGWYGDYRRRLGHSRDVGGDLQASTSYRKGVG